MTTDYSGRYTKPLGCNRHAMGGAAEGLGIEALAGDTEMVTVFDDFNGVVKEEGWGDAATWETNGWVLTEDAGVASVAESISMNDAAVTTYDYSSCIQIYGGTADNSGGSMQLDALNGTINAPVTNHSFEHIWIPEVLTIPAGGGLAGAAGDAAEALDHTSWMFATRVGFRADHLAAAGAGDWEGAFFIGWAAAGDTSLITHDTGVITGAANMCFGLHVCILGEMYGVSKRLEADAVSAAVGNYTQIQPAGSVDNTVANHCDVAGQTCWWDFAMRMDITDMSDDTANGTTRFWSRRVLPGVPLGPWNLHPTTLTNETPNAGDAVVPHIELITSAAAGEDCSVLIDWWAFGRNRVNR